MHNDQPSLDLVEGGCGAIEIAQLTGFSQDAEDNPFNPGPRLRVV